MPTILKFSLKGLTGVFPVTELTAPYTPAIKSDIPSSSLCSSNLIALLYYLQVESELENLDVHIFSFSGVSIWAKDSDKKYNGNLL